MITTKKILKLIRYKQQDNNEIKFSDYDIIQALNECIRYINQRFSLKNADFLEKIHNFNENEINAAIAEYNNNLDEDEQKMDYIDFAITGVDLPSDFLTLVSIIRAHDEYPLKAEEAIRKVSYDTYKIIGGKLYSKAKDINVLYRASIEGVKLAEDTINLPEIFIDGIVKCTGMILNNNADTDVMERAVDANIVSLIPSRRYSNMRVKMPFKV